MKTEFDFKFAAMDLKCDSIFVQNEFPTMFDTGIGVILTWIEKPMQQT